MCVWRVLLKCEFRYMVRNVKGICRVLGGWGTGQETIKRQKIGASRKRFGVKRSAEM